MKLTLAAVFSIALLAAAFLAYLKADVIVNLANAWFLCY
jgi:hypothetical protein